MATVVVTFFLVARFYVSNMDADFKEKRRKRLISTDSLSRWSMNSQRLEEIVAELMRPIGDLRHSFDTDLSALLEEYLTEAGLHALDAEEDVEGDGGGRGDVGGRGSAPAVPNFAELALLLQQSASIYGRKVDFLYQHVLSVSDSLQNSTEIANTCEAEAGGGDGGGRRRRRASGPAEFAHVELEAGAGARREPGCARPPPTLPRLYLELEPRAPAEGERPLRDFAGESIGVMQDFHVCWRLHRCALVDDLAGGAAAAAASLRPIPLMELQAAIEANAPPSPPPLAREESPPPDEPARCSTPLPPPATPPTPPTPPTPLDMPPPPPPPLKKERKRKSEINLDDLIGKSFKLLIDKERLRSSPAAEFEGAAGWVARVVAGRAAELRALRRHLAAAAAALPSPFRGFDYCWPADIDGFPGWSVAVGAETARLAEAARGSLRASVGAPHDDSDDDGFFEQSSLGSDHSRALDSPPHQTVTATTITTPGTREKSEAELAEEAEWAAWRARLAARAAGGQQRPPLDMCALAAGVLARLPAPPAAAPCPRVLAAAADATDVSRLFLATLFLANAGNVEVIQGAPLSLNSFSLKLVSADPRLYSAAAAADPVCAPPTAGPVCAPPTAGPVCAPPTPTTARTSQ